MYANFYYQRSTKKYGRGPWLNDGEVETHELKDGEVFDLLYIGEVYDQELFKDAELSV